MLCFLASCVFTVHPLSRPRRPSHPRRQHASALRDLAARAQGEITLREAVGELRAWCDQAEFKCTRERFGSKQVRRM